MEKVSDEEPVEMGQSQYGAVLMKLREEEEQSETADAEDTETEDESPCTSEEECETGTEEDKKEDNNVRAS